MLSNEIRDKVEKLVKGLAGAMYVCAMYGEKHRLMKEAIDHLYRDLYGILSERGGITIGVVGNEIAFEKEPFYKTSAEIRGFIGCLRRIKMEKISFSEGIKRKELAEFVKILAMKPESIHKTEDIEKILKSAGVKHISIGEIGIKDKKIARDLTEKEINGLTRKNYQDGVDYLTEAMEDVRKNQPLDIISARKLVSGLINSLLQNKQLLLILASTRSHDECTFVHDLNVSIFTLMQAEALGLEQNYLNNIGIAALLHDVGKLSVSGDILKKKGKLSEEERGEITLHAAKGAKILLETTHMNVLAAISAFEHHMLYDLSGYPKSLYGKKPNLASMMITISDFYDALRSKRPYHEGISAEETYEYMMDLSGKYFHPDLLNNFFTIIGVYPPGTLVELDTGEIGLVIKASILDMKRPRLEMLYDSSGEKEKTPHMVNLLEKDRKGNYKRSIVKSILPEDKFKIPEKYT